MSDPKPVGSTPSVAPPGPPPVGMGKSVAAIVAGSLSTIVLYIVNSILAHYGAAPLPSEIVAAVQTLITTAAVYWTPHNLGS